MLTTKQKAIEWIQTLPDDCTLADIQDYLALREMVERGMKDAEEGRVLSHEEVERRINAWQPSSGRPKA